MGKNYHIPSGENPYKDRNVHTSVPKNSIQKNSPINFEKERVCPACGKIIRLEHNFCKFCGVDLISIIPLGNSDKTLTEIAKTALTDTNADVRSDAVDTLGDLGEMEIIGILTYILLNDVDALVRKKAAEELGNFHNPISIDALTKSLKDRSPIVRKEAIEGLKKIKKMNKPKEKPKKEDDLEKIIESEKRVEPEKTVESEPKQKLEIANEKDQDDNIEEEPLKEIDPQEDKFYKL